MAANKRLIILNNPVFLNTLYDHYDEILYAPIFKSFLQKERYLFTYDELKINYPKIKWTEDFELEASDHILAWRAYNEKKVFGEHILNLKNRLFDHIDFVVPESFTAFRKIAEKKLPTLFIDAIAPNCDSVIKHLDYYFNQKKLPSTYFNDRNGMVGKDFSTKFSAFLSQGTLDVRYVYNLVKEYEKNVHANKSTYWIIFELLWREFFYWHYQKHTSMYFSQNGICGQKDFSAFQIYDYDQLRGFTNNDFFNAALNELELSGYMSNRARQMFASFWINDLKLNWRSGAYFFEENLIDYDVFSNYGNWKYLAGVGVDPRGKRYFNIDKQLERYDPDGLYLKKWREGAK